MNNFNYHIANDDLGITIVENIFINHYMPIAPGDFVKVYLLGLKYCNKNNLSSISNEIIAKSLNILESDVINAWKYWKKQGIVDFRVDSNGNYDITFKHITSLMLEGKNQIYEENLDGGIESAQFTELYNSIEYMYGRTLSQKEINTIASWLKDLHLTPEMVILLIEYCFELEKKDFNYLNKVALNWYDNCITTYDQAVNYIKQYKERYKNYHKIMDYLGFKRLPSKVEISTMDKWIYEYKMSLDLILQACDKTLAIDKPNFKYIDTVLTAWHNKNLRSISDLNKEKTKKNSTKKISDYDYDMLEKKLEQKMWSEENE